MPSKSKAQAHLMQAAAHNPEFAKKVGIKQDTAKEWSNKDSKDRTKKLPDKVAKETYTTTSSLAGPKGFKDQ